jgi:hypothetical protein
MRWTWWTRKRKLMPPKLFLDIDGVLAPFDNRQPDMEPVVVGGWHGTIIVSRSVIARLADLHAREVVAIEWLTSWEDDANTVLAPRVGLDTYPVHMEPAHRTELYWKEHVVRDHAATGARFIWVDDEMTDHDAHVTVAADYPDGLVIAPDPHVGLTHEHLDQIEAYAQAVA